MKYILSSFGAFLVVGLVGSDDEATADRQLANNLFDVYEDDSIFKGRINFESFAQFKRFLIYKEYFNLRMGKIVDSEWATLREAGRRATRILRNDISREEFMARFRAHSTKYHNIGQYQDES